MRDSSEQQIDAMKDEMDELRTWKEKVRICVSVFVNYRTTHFCVTVVITLLFFLTYEFVAASCCSDLDQEILA